MTKIAEHVAVAHPGHLRLIFRLLGIHAVALPLRPLAKLLYLDEVPMVHVPSINMRAWRRLIEHRSRLVGKRTRARSGIRALLHACGFSAPRGLWTKKIRAWLNEVHLPMLADTLQSDVLLEELDYFDRQVQRVQSNLDDVAMTTRASSC